METMFFLPVQFLDGRRSIQEWFSGEDKVMEAFIDFEGPRSGRVFLLVPDPTVNEMAANFLGLDEDEVSEEHAQDTLKETINMMTGRMLSIADRKARCALRIPRFAGEWNSADPEKGKSSGVLLLFETGKHHLAAGVVEPGI